MTLYLAQTSNSPSPSRELQQSTLQSPAEISSNGADITTDDKVFHS